MEINKGPILILGTAAASLLPELQCRLVAAGRGDIQIIVDDTLTGPNGENAYMVDNNRIGEKQRRLLQMEQLFAQRRDFNPIRAGSPYFDESTRMPNPEREAAAESKRARKAAKRIRDMYAQMLKVAG